jgi:hypothetical protein
MSWPKLDNIKVIIFKAAAAVTLQEAVAHAQTQAPRRCTMFWALAAAPAQLHPPCQPAARALESYDGDVHTEQ